MILTQLKTDPTYEFYFLKNKYSGIGHFNYVQGRDFKYLLEDKNEV